MLQFGGMAASRKKGFESVRGALLPWLREELAAFRAGTELARTLEKEHFGNGRPRYFRVRLARLDDGRAEQGVIVILTDITERRRTLEEIARLAIIVDSTDDAILSLALDGRIRSANRAAARNYGYPCDSLRGMPLFELVPEDRAPEVRDVLDQIGGGRAVLRFETVRRKKCGTLFPVSVTYSPIFRDGRIWGISAISRDITRRKYAESELQRTNEHLGLLLGETVKSLSSTLEKRDLYTSGHQQKVSRLSFLLGERIGMESSELEMLRIAGLLHDLGKVCVPMAILSKPARLSPGELALIRQHPETGFEILHDIPFPWPVGKIVLEHHERCDGSGYPGGLMEKDIEMGARILAVADIIEAMSSHRPYRAALGLSLAMEEIERQAGKTLDREVCRAAGALVEERRIEEIRGELSLCQ